MGREYLYDPDIWRVWRSFRQATTSFAATGEYIHKIFLQSKQCPSASKIVRKRPFTNANLLFGDKWSWDHTSITKYHCSSACCIAKLRFNVVNQEESTRWSRKHGKARDTASSRREIQIICVSWPFWQSRLRRR
jgi:hypothetical protein